jgi:hypothetical protein
MNSHLSEFGTLTRLAPEAQAMEQVVSRWLTEHTPLLWVPIIDAENFPNLDAAAQDLAGEMDGGWLLLRPTDFLTLPEGIKGWLMPVLADDTEVACGRWQKEIFFLRINNKATGAQVTYRSDVGHTPRTR